MLKTNSFAIRIQDKIGRMLSGVPITPNQWTILSFFISLIAAFFVLSNQFLYAAFFFLLAVAFDAIDGAVARATNTMTKFGAFLDGVVDRLVESAILVAFLFVSLPDKIHYLGFVLLLVFGTHMTSFVRAYAHHRGVIAEDDLPKMSGLFERAERCILLFLVLVAAHFNLLWAVYLAYIGAALSIFTFFQRILYVRGKK